MRFAILGLAMGLAAVTTLSALAQEDQDARRNERRQQFLQRFDKDGDGQLSEEERAAAREAFAQRRGEAQRGEGQPGERRRGQGQGRQAPNLDQLFQRLDQNSDGKLQKDELRGPFAERLAQADKDQDGTISKEEFQAATAELRNRFGQGARRPSVDETFAQYDKNSDGKLTKEELPEQLANFILRADSDNDGAVTKEELSAARERAQQNRGEGRRRPNAGNAN